MFTKDYKRKYVIWKACKKQYGDLECKNKYELSTGRKYVGKMNLKYLVGGFLSKPNVEKESEFGSHVHCLWAVSSMQGWRS